MQDMFLAITILGLNCMDRSIIIQSLHNSVDCLFPVSTNLTWSAFFKVLDKYSVTRWKYDTMGFLVMLYLCLGSRFAGIACCNSARFLHCIPPLSHITRIIFTWLFHPYSKEQINWEMRRSSKEKCKRGETSGLMSGTIVSTWANGLANETCRLPVRCKALIEGFC